MQDLSQEIIFREGPSVDEKLFEDDKDYYKFLALSRLNIPGVSGPDVTMSIAPAPAYSLNLVLLNQFWIRRMKGELAGLLLTL